MKTYKARIIEYTPICKASTGEIVDYDKLVRAEFRTLKRYLVMKSGAIIDLESYVRQHEEFIVETRRFNTLATTPIENPHRWNSNVWRHICSLEYIEAECDSLEECLLYLRKKGCLQWYVLIDYRITEEFAEPEEKGKLASEVYPNHHNKIVRIDNYCEEVYRKFNSEEYNKYFDTRMGDYRPFITELWFRRNDNSMRLMFSRKSEIKEFKDELKGVIE